MERHDTFVENNTELNISEINQTNTIYLSNVEKNKNELNNNNSLNESLNELNTIEPNTVEVNNNESNDVSNNAIEPDTTELSSKNSLIDLIKVNILNNIDNLSFKINNSSINIINIVINNTPATFDKLTNSIKDIISDGVIDHKDIPKILLLVSTLYKTDFKNLIKNMSLTSNDIIEFIKVLIKIFIELEIVHVKNKNDIYETIDASSELLELVIPSQEIKCGCFNFLFKKINLN